MEPYYEKSECAKCGSQSASTRHEHPTEYLPNKWGAERMQRRCKRCGYVWYEKPLDEQLNDENKQ